MKIILVICLGFLVSGVWFGTTILIGNTAFGKKEYTHYFLPIISAIIPLACILPWKSAWNIDFGRLLDFKLWGIVLITAVLVNVFIRIFVRKPYVARDKLHYLLTLFEAGSMEIPMRLLMMNFTVILLEYWKQPTYLSIFITGIIWCLAIVVQAIAYREPLKEAIVEIIASLLFSVGIGYVYFDSGMILFPIVGHVLERLIGLEMTKRLR